MKNYISAEEFLKLDKKVQDIFIEWWEPQIGDLVYDRISIVGVVVPVLCIGEYKTNLDKARVTPLLQMHQLIDFIEGKTKSMVILSHMPIIGTEYTVTVSDWTISDRVIYNEVSESFLKALWKVAIKIAEGIKNKKLSLEEFNKIGLYLKQGLEEGLNCNGKEE